MVTIKSKREIEYMKEACKVVAKMYEKLKEEIRPGMTTWELDQIAEKTIRSLGAIPAEKGYDVGIRGIPPYPASICISINDEVVHGIPGKRKLKNGDIVKLDISMIYKGYHSDSAATYPVGHISKEKEYLIEHTKKSLYEGIKQVKEGAKLGDIGHAIEQYAHEHHLSVVKELCGHGIGNELHEDPDVLNYGKAHTGMTLKAGMTIAIEPMLNYGERYVYMLDDDWTICTEDGSPSAHFEHTVLVTKDGYEILTGE